MTAQELLAEAQRQGIEVRLLDSNLQIRIAKGSLPPELAAAFRQMKEELREWFSTDPEEVELLQKIDNYPSDPEESLDFLRRSGLYPVLGPEDQLEGNPTSLPPPELYLVLRRQREGLVALLRSEAESPAEPEWNDEWIEGYDSDPAEVLELLRSCGVRLWLKPGWRIGFQLPEDSIPERELLGIFGTDGSSWGCWKRSGYREEIFRSTIE